MTFEEIKADFKEMWNMARNEDGNPFYLGAREAYEYAIAIIDKLESSWHPYPAEKPVSGLYRATLDTTPRITRDLYYNSVTGLWEHPRGGGELSVDVVAWMELPKPYKEDDDD